MESSVLDYVAQSCLDLSASLDHLKTDAEKDSLINDHIRRVWGNSTSIDDFSKNLEWVNVSDPISLADDCMSKIVVLDFWTYCCINCQHVLPDLAEIEKLYSDQAGLVVIGVHCAKFSAETETSNILAAVQRYNIKHPVVNDAERSMWKALGIQCWPTLLILGPLNRPIFVIVGEGQKEELKKYIMAAVKYFNSQLSDAKLKLSYKNYIASKESTFLKFPGKLSLNPFFRGRLDEPFLAISDSGNNRVILTDCSGKIIKVVGGLEAGFKDGKMNDARFCSPQGLCWLAGNVVVVCDTGNHALRALHLDDCVVEVLTGNGVPLERGDIGGRCLGLQSLCSPWDVVLYTTPDLDMSVRAPPPAVRVDSEIPPPPPLLVNGSMENGEKEKEKEKKDEKRRVLLISCAGSHQIWALFLDTTIWWRYKTFVEGTCDCIAGSGVEAARNSTYPHTAAFAQPSGIALRSSLNPELLIADSESSSIRRLALKTGNVSTLAGGDRNPLDLFAFGDVDDIGIEAKFQHPLGVAYCDSTKLVYVADSYNHKIKKIDISTHQVTTLTPSVIETSNPATFNEPSGLSITPDSKYLYVADTNNHKIKVINLAKNTCEDFVVQYPEPKFNEPENLILYKNDIFVNKKCGSLIIYFDVSLDNSDSKNVKFTEGAPQYWNVTVRDDNKDVTLDVFDFINCSHKGTKLPGRVEMKLKEKTDKTHYRLYLSFQTALCDNNVCFSHMFTVRSTMLLRDSVKLIESYRITCKVNPTSQISSSKNT